MFKHLCKLEHFANLSSHDAIVAKMVLPQVMESIHEQDYSSIYTPFVVSKPKWNEEGIPGYQKQTADVLKSLAGQFNQQEFIPVLCELFSKMLVISAEKNFDISTPKTVKVGRQTRKYFSNEHKEAYIEHEQVCIEWRKQGRPAHASHPAKIAKLNSQRKIQKIARDAEALNARKNHDDLMATFNQNKGQVCNKLKKIRGENIKRVDIPFIETLNGTFSGDNVLEGFCSNTETLCNDESETSGHDFYKMCVKDNLIIFEIAKQEAIIIPHMTLQILKDIIFKKLKLNKACDVNKLTLLASESDPSDWPVLG